MLVNHAWWPLLSLIAGGIYLDGAGREYAKCVSLRKGGIKIGTSKDLKIAAAFFITMAVIALWLMIFTILFLAGRM